jgi:hypothetical protein
MKSLLLLLALALLFSYATPEAAFTPYPAVDSATGLFGYLGINGAWAIPPQFVEAKPFSDGVAIVATKHSPPSERLQMQLINETGAFLTPTGADSNSPHEAIAVLETFFELWNANLQDDMLKICAPSWKATQTVDPRIVLFGYLNVRRPADLEIETITGADTEICCIISCTVTIDKQNNRPPAPYRYRILMLKEEGFWYVDPSSLFDNEAI